MPFSLTQKHRQFILYIAFVLSQTEVLINAPLYLPKCPIPLFTFMYFTITTIYLVYATISYSLFKEAQRGEALQMYEYIVLPSSVLCISILSANQGFVQAKVTGCVLLLIQSLLIICKIMNFGSVTREFAQISTVIRLIRVFKLTLMAILHLIIHNMVISVIILSLIQTISMVLFLFKFTYQKCIYEHALLIGVFCGIVSSVERLVETIFGFPYLFLGEIISIYFFWGKNTFLQSALQIKYINSLKRVSQNKQDDELLAGFLFVQDCLFNQRKSLSFSTDSKNQAAIYACSHLERERLNRIAEGNLCDSDSIFGMKADDIKLIKLALFESYIRKFYQTDSFNCFEFTVAKALELSQENKALILYYSFIQNRKAKMSVLEQCKFDYLYSKIAKQIDESQTNKQDINFIQFSDNLRHLKVQIQQCLAAQLSFIQFLTDKNRKEMFLENRLKLRHKMKKQVRNRIKLCLGQRIYFSSNQFKYLYLLYQVSVQKRFCTLQSDLQRYFLANQVQNLRYQSNQNSLVVLSGFNHGEIVNSNQVFKHYFSVTTSNTKRNIGEYLPTERQKAKHLSLMSQYVQFQNKHERRHEEYTCHLAIERELGALKLRTIESFTITSRIYYENSSTFNYVCCLIPRINHTQVKDKFLLTKKDCKSFVNKGIQFTVLGEKKIEQLDDGLTVNEIGFQYESKSMTGQNLQEDKQKEGSQKSQKGNFLQEKAGKIEKKFVSIQHSFQFSLLNILQMGSIILLPLLVLTLHFTLDAAVDNYSSSITDLLNPINEAQLVRNRILLQQQILSFNIQTSYFPNNLCSSFGIGSLNSYIDDKLRIEVQEKADPFINSGSRLGSYGSISKDLYSKQFSSNPFIANPKQIITYQKYIQLIKINKYIWAEQLNTSSLKTNFYSKVFPSLLLNSTLNSPTSLTSVISQAQSQYVSDIQVTISKYSVLSCISIASLLLAAIILRLMDTRTILEYLRIVECIPPQILTERVKEIKSSLQQLRQLQASHIESVQFQDSLAVEIVRDKQAQSIPMRQFTDWQMLSKSQNDRNDLNQNSFEDDLQFLQKYGRQQQPSIFVSCSFFRQLFFNKVYIAIMVASLVAVAILTSSAIDMEGRRVKVLVHCTQAAQQLNQIQEKMINLVAYNWLKVLSLNMPSINMTIANQLYSDSINSLMGSDYSQRIRAAYSKDISDQILYGSVCSFFANKTACQLYKNHIFSSGFSILNPLVVKQAIQVNKISTDPQYYISNLCDKTWLLFEGVIPMTHNIALYGFNQMKAKTSVSLGLKIVPIIVVLGVVAVITLLEQWLRYVREALIREQVFSIESIDKLYGVEQYKPFFNRIYTS